LSCSWAPSDPWVFFHRNTTWPQATAARALTFWNSKVEKVGKFDKRISAMNSPTTAPEPPGRVVRFSDSGPWLNCCQCAH
jgi:hypothetical protein